MSNTSDRERRLVVVPTLPPENVDRNRQPDPAWVDRAAAVEERRLAAAVDCGGCGELISLSQFRMVGRKRMTRSARCGRCRRETLIQLASSLSLKRK